MNYIDPKIWAGQVSSNWKYRIAAANSVLQYI